jgi:hypothetical protein
MCHICGNDIESTHLCCPFCGSDQKDQQSSASGSLKLPFSSKTVNLEQGRPTVAQALLRLENAIENARSEGVAILTLIHGYGSSGKGGGIRVECRKTLEYLFGQRKVLGVVYGEDFSQRQGPVKQLLHRFPQLSRHSHLNRKNKGITLVVLV